MSQTKSGNTWLFVFLAYAITWGYGIPLALGAPSGAEPDPLDISQLGALGPAIAGLIVIFREQGRQGLINFFKRLTQWRFGIAWYAAILLVPLIWLGILPVIILHSIQHGTLPSFLGPSYGVPGWKDAWWFFLFILVIGGGQEELGWRGYLVPKLQEKRSALVASLIVGVVWATWHLPFLFIPGSSLYGVPFIPYLIQLTSLSILLAWLYNNTDSLLACVLYHTWSNFAGAYLMVEINEPVYGLLVFLGQLVLAVLLVVIYGRKKLTRERR